MSRYSTVVVDRQQSATSVGTWSSLHPPFTTNLSILEAADTRTELPWVSPSALRPKTSPDLTRYYTISQKTAPSSKRAASASASAASIVTAEKINKLSTQKLYVIHEETNCYPPFAAEFPRPSPLRQEAPGAHSVSASTLSLGSHLDLNSYNLSPTQLKSPLLPLPDLSKSFISQQPVIASTARHAVRCRRSSENLPPQLNEATNELFGAPAKWDTDSEAPTETRSGDRSCFSVDFWRHVLCCVA